MNDDDMIERFRMYSARFEQASVSGEVYTETLQYIIRLRKERDAARREVCRIYANPRVSVFLLAERRGWDCFKEEP